MTKPDSLSVMAWNIWGKLNEDPRYTVKGKTARERTIDILKENKADIICMLETYGSASDIANALGYHYCTPDPEANLAIFSRYPLSDAGSLRSLSSFSFIGATAELPSGRKIRIYDIWLTCAGCDVSKLRNRNTADQMIVSWDVERKGMLDQFLRHADVEKHIANRDIPVIVAGDFNSLSHLDYTEETRNDGLNYGRVLPISVSQTMEAHGFTDTYRMVHPKVTKETLGYTWTTVGLGYHWEPEKAFFPVEKNPAPEDRGLFCRIDFIYCAGSTLKPTSSRTIIHHSSNHDRCFPEFPSDHAAVLTIFGPDSTKGEQEAEGDAVNRAP